MPPCLIQGAASETPPLEFYCGPPPRRLRRARPGLDLAPRLHASSLPRMSYGRFAGKAKDWSPSGAGGAHCAGGQEWGGQVRVALPSRLARALVRSSWRPCTTPLGPTRGVVFRPAAQSVNAAPVPPQGWQRQVLVGGGLRQYEATIAPNAKTTAVIHRNAFLHRRYAEQ